MTETELHVQAARIARVAMGRGRERHGRRVRSVWLADEDPLAWWTLTESIVALAERYQRSAEPCP